MNILMGNNTLSLLAGSETWTETLAKQFKWLGHNVTVFSTDLGMIATKLEAVGVKCINKVQTKSGVKPFSFVLESSAGGEYDVIICNHNQITKDLHAAFPQTPIIATIHGPLHKGENGDIWPEHPVTEFKVNQYVGVSEEIQHILKADYGIESCIIRNFIDLKRFKKPEKINEKPKKFLINSNYYGPQDPITQIIKAVADHYQGELMAVGTNFSQTYEVWDVVSNCDVVVGMGRSLLEGMAAGKLAICHGRWGTGGVVTPESYEAIRNQNFSGRNSKGQFMSPEEMIAVIDKAYTQENIDEIYEIVKKEHDVVVNAQQYLELAQSLIIKQ